MENEIPGLVMRKAGKEDTPVIAEALWQSENNGFEAYSYAKIFDLKHEEYIRIFSELLKNDTPGHHLTWKAYRIAEVNGEPAAVFSWYLEGEAGKSVHLMTGLLMEFFPRDKVVKAFQELKKNQEVALPKTPGAFQFDSGYTFDAFRRKGLFIKLYHWAYQNEAVPLKANVEGHAWTDNEAMKGFLTSQGYERTMTRTFANSTQGRIQFTKHWKDDN